MFNSTLSGLKELELARIVQESLLPKGKLEIGQYRFYGFSTMQCQVGGDYFDFKVRDNNCVEVILGDVSGHGLPAALVVAMAKSAFMLLSGLESLLPSDVLTKISQAFLKILNKLKMMTCFLARIDLSRHKLYCSNAGQNAPMLLDRSKEVLEIKIKAFPLGTRQKTNYQNEEVSFPEGGWFVLYSDGVVEALSPSGEMYGYERLKDSIKANCGKSPTLTVEKILANLKAFTLEVPWADDVTVFVIQREEF
ncbi:serine/threonine-protein phosphatase [bacterium]|nr:serine/threonine-protein phosphatase [bacterium]